MFAVNNNEMAAIDGKKHFSMDKLLTIIWWLKPYSISNKNVRSNNKMYHRPYIKMWTVLLFLSTICRNI